MGQVKIWTDSTCDLTEDQIFENGITVLPLCVVMGDKSYYDGLDITPDEIYAWADANRTTPKTAAISFDKVSDALEEAKRFGDEVVYIGISEQMSTTCNVVRLAAREADYPHVRVVDSMSLSTGIGLQVLYAAELTRQGCGASEIVKRLEARMADVRASFVVDTLTYLARGGRCNAATALLGNALKLHPMIAVKNGAMGVGKKYRGTMKAVLLKYAKDLEKELLAADATRVFITHSGCDEDQIQAVKEYVESLNHFSEICITRAGGVISSHCGPGTLGVLFYAK